MTAAHTRELVALQAAALAACRAAIRDGTATCETSTKDGVTMIEIKYMKPIVPESITITLQP